MKRLILLCVSVALLLSCFAISGFQKGVSVGAGFGIGEKVKEPEDLIPLLEFIIGGESSEGALSYDKESFPIVTLSNDANFIPEDLFEKTSSEKMNSIISNSTLAMWDDNGLNDVEETVESESETEAETDKNDFLDKFTSKRKGKYKSTTVSIETNLSSVFDSTNHKLSSGVNHLEQKITRSMTMYITDDATFYRTKGQSFVHKDVVETKKSNTSGGFNPEESREYTVYRNYVTTAVFDMDMLSFGDVSYAYFREYLVAEDSETMQIKNEYLNKWIEMPEDFLDAVVSVDSQNRSAFRTMGELINMLIEFGEFSKGDSIVQIDEHDINRLYRLKTEREDDYIENGSMKFKIDLTSPSTPMIAMSADATNTKTYSASDYGYYGYYYGSSYTPETGTVTQKIQASETMTFSNINNTVISFDEDQVDVFMKDEKDSEKLFLINKKEQDDD